MDAFKKHLFTVQTHLPLLFVLIAVMLHSGCASRPPENKEIGKVKTKSIIFTCDPQINQGLLLPVDVIYVTRYHMPREVIAIGPDKWFNSSARVKWQTRQTLDLKGEETKTVQLNKLWLKDTKLLIVFADFKDVVEPQSQQIIIDKSSKRKEKIRVMPQQLAVDGGGKPCLFF